MNERRQDDGQGGRGEAERRVRGDDAHAGRDHDATAPDQHKLATSNEPRYFTHHTHFPLFHSSEFLG